jgi:hypothetical protein
MISKFFKLHALARAWAHHKPPATRTQALCAVMPAHAPLYGLRLDTSTPLTMLEVATGWSPFSIANNQASRLTEREVQSIAKPCHRAAEAIAQGRGDRQHWVALCSTLTVGRAIESGGKVRGLKAHFDRAEEVLLAIADRAGENARPHPAWNAPALRHTEIDQVRLLAELHTFQLRQLAYGEYREAMRLAIARVQSGKGEAVNLPFGTVETVG